MSKIRINQMIDALDESDSTLLMPSHRVAGLERLTVQPDQNSLDGWALAHPTKLAGTIALVIVGDSGFSEWLKYDSSVSDWTAFDAGSVILYDSDKGVAPAFASRINLGNGLDLSFAADDPDNATVDWAGFKVIDSSDSETTGVKALKFDSNLAVSYDSATSTMTVSASGGGSSYTFDYPLKLDGNAVGVVEDALEPMRSESIYLKMGERKRLSSKYGTDQYAGWTHSVDLMPEQIVVADGVGQIVQGDIFNPKALFGNNNSDYLVIVDLELNETAPADGVVEVILYQMNNDDVDFQNAVMDIEGNPVAVRASFKQGDKISLGEIVAVVNSGQAGSENGFKIIVSNTFPEGFYLYAEPETSVVISSLEESLSSRSIIAYEADKQHKVDFVYEKFEEDIADFRHAASNDILLSDRPTGLTELDSNWDLELFNWVKYSTLNGQFTATDPDADKNQTNESAKWYIGRYFSKEAASILNGHDLTYDVRANCNHRGLKVVRFNWTDAGDPIFPVITGFDQYGNPYTSTGWSAEIIDIEVLGDQTDSGFKDHTGTFTSSGTDAFALVVYATNSLDDGNGNKVVVDNAQGTVTIDRLNIGPATAFSGYIVNSVNPHHLDIVNRYARFTNPTHGRKQSILGFSTGRRHTPLGSKADGTLDITIGQGNAFVFGSQGKVKIRSVFQVAQTSALTDGETVTVHLMPEFVNDNGVNTLIPGAEKDITVTGGGLANYAMEWEFTVEVQAGQEMIFYASADKDGKAEIVALPNKAASVITIEEQVFAGSSSDEGEGGNTNLTVQSEFVSGATQGEFEYVGELVNYYAECDASDRTQFDFVTGIDSSMAITRHAPEKVTLVSVPDLNKVAFTSESPFYGNIVILTK